jgi:hypothetical protein
MQTFWAVSRSWPCDASGRPSSPPSAPRCARCCTALHLSAALPQSRVHKVSACSLSSGDHSVLHEDVNMLGAKSQGRCMRADPAAVYFAQVEASAGAQAPADGPQAAAADGAERPQKRARLDAGGAGSATSVRQPAGNLAASSPEPVGRQRTAEAPSPAVLREWRHFAEQLGAAERAAQAAEVRCQQTALNPS